MANSIVPWDIHNAQMLFVGPERYFNMRWAEKELEDRNLISYSKENYKVIADDPNCIETGKLNIFRWKPTSWKGRNMQEAIFNGRHTGTFVHVGTHDIRMVCPNLRCNFDFIAISAGMEEKDLKPIWDCAPLSFMPFTEFCSMYNDQVKHLKNFLLLNSRAGKIKLVTFDIERL